jgi:hypothetical protein
MISSHPQSKYQMEGIKSTLEVEVHKQTTMDHKTIKFTNHNSNHGWGHVFFKYNPLRATPRD